MDRRGFLGISSTGLIGLASGCRRYRPAGGTIKVAAYPALSMSGLYVAHEDRYFATEGLKVEIQTITNPEQLVALLVSGRLDACFVAFIPAYVNAVQKGAAVRIVAGREFASPGCGSAGTLYGRRASFPRGLTDLRELKGKRVAANGRASLGELYLDTILSSAGMTAGDVDFTPLSDSESVAALLGGKVDAIVFSHVDQQLAAPGIIQSVGLSDVRPNLQFSFIWFGPSLLRTNIDEGTRFLAAYLKGVEAFLAGRTPRYVEEMARATGRNPILARSMCRNIIAPDGAIDFSSLDYCLDWAVRKGYSLKGISATELVDGRFLAEVERRSAVKLRGY